MATAITIIIVSVFVALCCLALVAGGNMNNDIDRQ